ncbi:MAG: YggT family protein [Treponema sp.]|jgi:YggT family protein|nr:YggT family protein [Treponema sp.]
MMAYLASILAGMISIYMLLIFIRILLSWFSGLGFGAPMYFLQCICDPYLNWWRRFRIFKNSPVDFSPILALGFLSLARGILTRGAFGRLTLGLTLAFVVNALWVVVSWILFFFTAVLVLRLVAFLGNFNIYSPFWRLVDLVAQPVMYRICRILFPSRIISYLARIIVSIVVLLIITTGLGTAVHFGTALLQALPL